MMRRFLFQVLVVAITVVVVAVAGGSFPDGHPVNDATSWLRDFGEKFADGFGGGYTAIDG